MNREAHKLIAEKLMGWYDIHFDRNGNMYAKLEPSWECRTSVSGRFSERDADAISLLPEIEKKGWHFCLYNYGGAYQFDIGKDHADASTSIAMPRPTIAMAITAAVLNWLADTESFCRPEIPATLVIVPAKEASEELAEERILSIAGG